MKEIIVPKISFEQNVSELEVTQRLESSGFRAEIDTINWQNEFPECIATSVMGGHDGNNFYLLFTVRGETLRAVNNRDFMSVWEDSCVEFFMQREGEKMYRNFECNATGVLLASKRESRDNAEKLSTAEMSAISRLSVIRHRYREGREVSDWQLLLIIPKACMGFGDEELLSKQVIRGNFYKCGDATEKVHYQSWNPINAEKPNFHLPEFFGKIQFAE